jgi:transcription elongation factor Elf1
MIRTLETFDYSCPFCTSDLIVVGVDFSHNFEISEARSTFECSGCKETFYYIEKPHIRPKEMTEKFHCRYCNRRCTNYSLADDWTDYWKCDSCNVSYEHRYNPGLPDTQIINMYTTINNRLHVMRQFMDQIKTSIEILPDNVNGAIIAAQEFPFLFPNINPSNIQNKIKTYLIFS